MDINSETGEQCGDAIPSGYVDTTNVGMEMYLLVKDADTNETLVGQRG